MGRGISLNTQQNVTILNKLMVTQVVETTYDAVSTCFFLIVVVQVEQLQFDSMSAIKES